MDVLVVPSTTVPHWKEQFGRVLIEAMACGIPVVGSDSGEIPQVIGEAGLIFPEEHEASLRGHLSRLMKDKRLCYALAEKGRTRVKEGFAQRHIALATHDVYVDMMGQQG